jgi:hypothetical protein
VSAQWLAAVIKLGVIYGVAKSVARAVLVRRQLRKIIRIWIVPNSAGGEVEFGFSQSTDVCAVGHCENLSSHSLHVNDIGLAAASLELDARARSLIL